MTTVGNLRALVLMTCLAGLGVNPTVAAEDSPASTDVSSVVKDGDSSGQPEIAPGDKAGKGEEKPSPEAKAVAAVVARHRAIDEPVLRAARAQVDALLKAGPPKDPDKLKQWRKQLRRAISAEHKAIDDASESMRAEMDSLKKQRSHEK